MCAMSFLDNSGGPQGGYHGYNDENYGPPPHRLGPGMGGRGRGSQRYGPAYGPPPPEYGPHADSPVLMVYGLEPSKINTDKVFNIFCLYGNVERVSQRRRALYFFYTFLIVRC